MSTTTTRTTRTTPAAPGRRGKGKGHALQGPQVSRTVVTTANPSNSVRRVRGSGAYSLSDAVSAVAKPFVDDTPSEGTVNKLARMAGNTLGSASGIPGLGSLLGNAGSWLARIAGFGAYRVKYNTVAAPGFSNISSSGGPDNIPEFGPTTSRGTVRVRHREFVTDVYSSQAFNLTNYLIHVGNPALCPWLATLAQNFESARIHGMLFQFKPTSSYAVSGTQAMGNVIMCTDYDVVDANYASKREMEICEFSTSAMSNCTQIHPIECDPKQNVLAEHYIEYGATTIAQFPDDPRFGCLGNFQIATNGMPTTGQAVGELWVTYDVELLKPQITESPSIGAAEYHASGSITTAGVVTQNGSTFSGWPVFGPPFLFTTSSAGTAASNSVQITYNGVPGNFLVLVTVATVGGNANQTTVPSVFGPTAAFVSTNYTVTGSHTNYQSVNPTGTLTWQAVAFVSFKGTGDGIAMPMAYGASATSYYDVIVVPMNSSINARRRATTALDLQLQARDEQLAALTQRLSALEQSEEPIVHINHNQVAKLAEFAPPQNTLSSSSSSSTPSNSRASTPQQQASGSFQSFLGYTTK